MRQQQAEKRTFSPSIRVISLLLQFCTGILLVLLVSFGTYIVYSNSMQAVIGTNRADVLSQIGGRIRDFKSNAYTLSNLYYNDSKFGAYALRLADPEATAADVAEFAEYMDQITARYRISFNQVNLDYYVVYRSVNGDGYCSIAVPKDYDYIDPEIRIWYRDLYRAQGGIVDVACYKDKALGTNSFVAARTVMNDAGQIVGYLMINVSEQQIFNTYASVVAPNSNIYITDDRGYILSSNVTKVVGSQYFNMQNLEQLFGDKVYAVVDAPRGRAMFSKYREPTYGFTVFEETTLDELLAPIRRTRNIVVGITVLAAVLGGLLSWRFSGHITRPILRLRDYVLQVEAGDLDTPLDFHSYAELNTLSDGIHEMLARIRRLIQSEKKKEAQKRKMQYAMLQAQINPHFMYNTLFSIKCVTDMNDTRKASEMLSALIQLLRTSLSNPDEMTTIRRQMDALRQYASLQQFRYGDGFDVIIEYDDAIADCQLPPLLVQPLVENAIVHGGKVTTNGVIAVSARPKRGRLVIEVEDNGAGMTNEQIEKVLHGDYDSEKPHIGLRNIYERIQLMFGEEYSLRIESQPEEGTKIIMNLPLLRGESEVPHD